MVRCVSSSLTSDTSLFVSLINLSVGCEIFDCISLNAAACCGPVCTTNQCIAHHTHIGDFENSLVVKGRSKSRCVCVNIDGIASAVNRRRVVTNNRMVHFPVKADTTQTKTLYLP